MILVPNEIAWLVLNVGGWTGDDAVVGTCVILAESGGDTDAIGKVAGDGFANRDLGLGQISNRWHGARLQRFRWRDPYDNVRMMREVFNEWQRRPDSGGDGWKAWHVYTSGAWEGHDPAARIGLRFPWAPPPSQAGWRT